MATLGARAAAAFGAEAAFTDMCATAFSRIAKSPLAREGAKMAKEVAQDTFVSQALDAVGLGPPPSVSRGMALASVASGGAKAAFKETAGVAAGNWIDKQKQNIGFQPLAMPGAGMLSSVSSAFSGLCQAATSVMPQMPAMAVSPVFSNAAGMARSAQHAPSFSGGIIDAISRGPSIQPMMPSLTARSAASHSFLPSFQPARGTGSFTAPKATIETDNSFSGPSTKNKV